MKIVEGDLIQLAQAGYFDVVLHGCNCHCTMQAGIARMIKAAFPEAENADLATTPGDPSKLGTMSSVKVPLATGSLVIVNCYTQYDFSGPGVLVDYTALRSCFQAVRTQFHGLRIGYPKIGAGLAKGDWRIIAKIISEELAGEEHTLVVYKAASD